MMDCTDRHDRFFLRLISSGVRLYTEMITSQALVFGNRERLLAFHPAEHPLALQLGGSEPDRLGQCARMGEAFGYDEINLNVGCPSDRVKAGRFGACLMLEPNLVAECVAAMQAQTHLPVTVKCRIGVDDQDSYASLQNFLAIVAESGCQTFIVHARKALLSGLSPKQNREIPPLRYDIVRRIKQDFPALTIIINGGIKTIADIDDQLQSVDGVMIGREAYANPYFLSEIEANYFANKKQSSRQEVVQKFIPYIHEQLKNGIKLTTITRHMLGLFHGQRGAAAWRRYLSNEAWKPGSGIEVIEKALALTSA